MRSTAQGQKPPLPAEHSTPASPYQCHPAVGSDRQPRIDHIAEFASKGLEKQLETSEVPAEDTVCQSLADREEAMSCLLRLRRSCFSLCGSFNL